jgi:hypothetical protein
VRRLALTLVMLLASALPATAQTAEFKGMPTLSRELAPRLAPAGMTFDLDWYLPAPGLDYLLGKWSSFGSEHAFRNGVPNALNMTVYHATLSRFSTALGDWCKAPPLTFENRFAGTLWALCRWPAQEAQNDTVLLSFWVGLMGYGAPESEYQAWRAFFLDTYRDKPARETVSAMALAIFLNPHFLLHR